MANWPTLPGPAGPAIGERYLSAGGDGVRKSPELPAVQPAPVVCGSPRLPNNRSAQGAEGSGIR
jgi:hypothetical protein